MSLSGGGRNVNSDALGSTRSRRNSSVSSHHFVEFRPASTASNQDTADVPLSEFDKKYPRDVYGDEMSDSARVWRVYKDEATTNDNSLIDRWNRSLDILLIFSGLFSAVITGLIAESYHQLQPDWTEYTARLLFAAIARGDVTNGTLPSNIAALSPSLPFSPPWQARWINGLLLLSLALSLSVALACIIAKQWLVQYEERVFTAARSTRDWARRRALYFQGLETWKISTVIESLSAVLHGSLFLFFAGLVMFFWPLDLGASSVLAVFAIVLVSLYTYTVFISYAHISCPYYLPQFMPLHRLFDDVLRLTKMQSWSRTTEAVLLSSTSHALEAAVLIWLSITSPSQEVNTVGIHAIGALRVTSLVLQHLQSNARSLCIRVSYAYNRAWISADRAPNAPGSTVLSPAVTDYLRVGNTIVLLAKSWPNTFRSIPGPNPLDMLIMRYRFLHNLWPWEPAHILALNAVIVYPHSVAEQASISPTEHNILAYVPSHYPWHHGRNDYAHHPVHVLRSLELTFYAGSKSKQRDLYVYIGLMHSCIKNGQLDQFREQLEILVQVCLLHNIPHITNGGLPFGPRMIISAAIEKYCAILLYVSDGLVHPHRFDLLLTLLEDLTHLHEYMAQDGGRPSTAIANLLKAFVGTRSFLKLRFESKSKTLEMLLGLLTPVFVKNEFGYPGEIIYVSESAKSQSHWLVNISSSIVATGTAASFSFQFGVLTKHYPSEAIALLQRNVGTGSTSAWCDYCVAVVATLQTDGQRKSDWTIISAAASLAKQLSTSEHEDARQLADQLFSVDFFTLMLRNVSAFDTIFRDMVLNDMLYLLRDGIPTLAPQRWIMVRDGVRGLAAEITKAFPVILTVIDEVDARLAIPSHESVFQSSGTIVVSESE